MSWILVTVFVTGWGSQISKTPVESPEECLSQTIKTFNLGYMGSDRGLPDEVKCINPETGQEFIIDVDNVVMIDPKTKEEYKLDSGSKHLVKLPTEAERQKKIAEEMAKPKETWILAMPDNRLSKSKSKDDCLSAAAFTFMYHFGEPFAGNHSEPALCINRDTYEAFQFDPKTGHTGRIDNDGQWFLRTETIVNGDPYTMDTRTRSRRDCESYIELHPSYTCVNKVSEIIETFKIQHANDPQETPELPVQEERKAAWTLYVTWKDGTEALKHRQDSKSSCISSMEQYKKDDRMDPLLTYCSSSTGETAGLHEPAQQEKQTMPQPTEIQ